MNLQLTLAWRYLNGRKLRTFLTTLAIIFGVLVIFGMNIILPTMISALQANVQGMSGVVDYSVTLASGRILCAGDRPENPGGGRRARRFPDPGPDGQSAGRIFRRRGRPGRVGHVLNLVGLDPDAARSVRTYPVQEGGRFLTAADTASAVISQSLADKLGIGLGERIPASHHRRRGPVDRDRNPSAADHTRHRGSAGDAAAGAAHDQ